MYPVAYVSGLKKKPRVNTKSCKVKDLLNKKLKNPLIKKGDVNTFIPSILTKMFALLKTGICKMRNISVNSPKKCTYSYLAPNQKTPLHFRSSLRTDQ